MRFSPNVLNPVIVSCGWDKVVKVSLFNVLDSQLNFPAPNDVFRKYICYFREQMLNETTFSTKISDASFPIELTSADHILMRLIRFGNYRSSS